MIHTCHAAGCTVEVPPTMLMCRAHWLSVPKWIRDEVLHHYQPGQCDSASKITPSFSWHEAADLAIAAVARKEGRIKEALAHEASAERWRERARRRA